MDYRPLDNEARRILIDATQAYEAYLDAMQKANHYVGGMRWKRTGEREYLFQTRGGKGYGRSLGARSPETESIYAQFHTGKAASQERKHETLASLQRLARFCIAAGINRVPKISANVIRTLDNAGLMGRGLRVVGAHAIFAYEAAAGVMVDAGLMATTDVDLLFDAQAKLHIVGDDVASDGLMGLLRKADKSFELAGKGHFRAINKKGFMVELVKPLPRPPQKVERQTIGSADGDLIAAEMEGFTWLRSAPGFMRIAIAEDGYPVRLHAPDPRFFALNKFWVSTLRERNPVKRPRDLDQARVVADLAEHYLGLSFDDERLSVFPARIRALARDLRPTTPIAPVPSSLSP